MIIHVTAQDIAEAGHKARDNPITRAMQRETQQPWIVFDGYTAHELSLPYRSVKLPVPIATHWQQYQETGLMQPFEFEFAALLPDVQPALPSTPATLPTHLVKPAPLEHRVVPTLRQQRRDRRQQERRLADRRRQERRHDAGRRHVERVSAAS